MLGGIVSSVDILLWCRYSPVSSLLFCLGVLLVVQGGVMKPPSVIMDLPTFPFSASYTLRFCGLVVCTFRISMSSLWVNPLLLYNFHLDLW